jgi:hypothetical protein
MQCPKESPCQEEMQKRQVYLRMEDARRLRSSTLACLASATRLWRRAAYSVWVIVSLNSKAGRRGTYGSILGLLGVATLQGHAVTLVLKTLRSNKALDLWRLGIWLLSFTLWLNLTTDNELANLEKNCQHFEGIGIADVSRSESVYSQ